MTRPDLRAVPCPSCAAYPGEKCEEPDGRLYSSVHPARAHAAYADAYRPATPETGLMFRRTADGVHVYRMPEEEFLGTVHETPEALRFATTSPLDGLFAGRPVRLVVGEPISAVDRWPSLDEIQNVIDYFRRQR